MCIIVGIAKVLLEVYVKITVRGFTMLQVLIAVALSHVYTAAPVRMR